MGKVKVKRKVEGTQRNEEAVVQPTPGRWFANHRVPAVTNRRPFLFSPETRRVVSMSRQDLVPPSLLFHLPFLLLLLLLLLLLFSSSSSFTPPARYLWPRPRILPQHEVAPGQ